MAVRFNPEKLRHYALGENAIAATLLAQGFKTSGGELRDGVYTQPILVDRAVGTVQEVKDMVVFSTPDGAVVRLGDIADVTKEYPAPTSYITNNYEKCILLSVQMKPGHNIVDMGSDVDRQLEEFQKEIPSGVTLFKITDQPVVVKQFCELFPCGAYNCDNRGGSGDNVAASVQGSVNCSFDNTCSHIYIARIILCI